MFCSWNESSQDRSCFSVLEMYRLLVAGQVVSKDCWDLLLCSLVSLTQVKGGLTLTWSSYLNHLGPFIYLCIYNVFFVVY